MSSSRGTTFLWTVFLICSTLILASPKPSQRLQARQALASTTSSTVSSTESANFTAAIAGATASKQFNVSQFYVSQFNVSQSNVSSSASPVPMVNSPLLLPSLSGCTSGDTGTVTFTSEFAHHTGFETIEEDQEFWNDTGTVWVIKVVSPGYWVQDLGLFNGNNSDPEDSNAISLDPSSSVFNITVPTHGCIISRPAISFQVEPTQTTSNVESTYTLSISGEYPCASNTILNSPASPSNCYDNPAYELSADNWIAQNVDELLYEWWFDSRDDECDPESLGSSTLRKTPSAPDTSQPLPAQLALWATGSEKFDCTLGSSTCAISSSPCDNDGIPPWAFLALMAIQNLQNTMTTIYNLLANAVLLNSLIAGTAFDVFNPSHASAADKAILALTFIGALVGVLGIFWTLVIPAAEAIEEAVEDAVAEGAEAAGGALADSASESGESWADALANQAVEEEVDEDPDAIEVIGGGNGGDGGGDDGGGEPGTEGDGEGGNGGSAPLPIVKGIGSPKASPGQGGAIYGSIPGALVTASSSVWSKIISEANNPLAEINTYDDLLAQNWNFTMLALNTYTNNLLNETDFSAMLMVALFGGVYADNFTIWTDTEITEALNDDISSRMVNNIWGQTQVYVQFTNLEDGNTTTNCTKDLHGPQSSKYCADGGVYYLHQLGVQAGGGAVLPLVQEPQGFSKLGAVALEPQWMTSSSAQLYRTAGLGINLTDAYAFTDAISALISGNNANPNALIGQLPGEWTFNTCDGGKNYFGYDWSVSTQTQATGGLESDQAFGGGVLHEWVPCGCGYQGNETALFWAGMGGTNMSEVDQLDIMGSCSKTMAMNNNQGWLNLNGGPPPSGEIVFSSEKHMTITYRATSATPVPQNPPWYV